MKAEFELPNGFRLETFLGKDNSTRLDEIERLRLRVWLSAGFEMKLNSSQADNRWVDGSDNLGTHFAIINDGIVIAASHLTIHSSISDTPHPDWFSSITVQPKPPIAYISRLVVGSAFQRQGLGEFLDQTCIERAIQQQAKSVLVWVPEYRIAPLSRRGFQLISEPQFGIMFPTLKWATMLLSLDG